MSLNSFTIAEADFAQQDNDLGTTMPSHAQNYHYEAVTRDISVTVVPQFIEEQSIPHSDRYVWAYTIEVENKGPETVQLNYRTWFITDGAGQCETVKGPGVVGEQPILNPGDSFQYTSGCPLKTPSGFMEGHYTMQLENGDEFDIKIPAFALDIPDSSRTVN